MKLSEHVDKLRDFIEAAFDKHFARLGIGKTKQLDIEKLPEEVRPKRMRFEEMLENHIGETGDYEHAREKLIDELTFTLFNRLAAVKVMEAAALFPPVLTKQPEHGDRSFGHKAWLEMYPHMHSEELEGIREYLKTAFDELGETLPLYSKAYPYALLPDTISLNEIIDAFNAVEKDSQVGSDIWQSDDVLGWMYESYNNVKKKAHKDSGDKTEYNKVSLQSQVYTPRWVVQFLVENSLGKLYLEMHPDSEIKRRYKIANVGTTEHTENTEKKNNKNSVSSVYSVVKKPLHEIKLIDPACGSGNFLLYAFDFFYELYVDQIDNYGADYNENEIPKLIIENNLHGIDLDDRAVQLAQLGLFIKAKKKHRTIGELAFNVVSSDFYLPEYETVKNIFEPQMKTDERGLGDEQKTLIREIWDDLKFAYKFGSLIRIDERVNAKLKDIEKRAEGNLFGQVDLEAHKSFAATFFINLKTAVEQYAQAQGNTFLTSKTRDAITFLELLTTEYDVATANPPYTDSADFGPELREFIEDNYKKPYKFHTNLYATFIKRCYDLTGKAGFIAMLHPLTFMYIKSFEDVRKFILNKTSINLLAELGLGGVFANSAVQVDACMHVLEKGFDTDGGVYFDLKPYKNHTNKPSIFIEIYHNYISGITDNHVYTLPQSKLKIIKSWPFIYWISDEFREKFGTKTVTDVADVALGLKTANNNRYLRFIWEVDSNSTSTDLKDGKKWIIYLKGGAYNKWAGNEWLVVDWENDGQRIKNQKNSQQIEKGMGFRAGITLSTRSAKGVCGRGFEKNRLFDMAASCILYKNDNESFYWLGYSNSKLFNYILGCLNSTINKQPEDIRRLPAKIDFSINSNSESCYKIKKHLLKFDLLNIEFEASPLSHYKGILEPRLKIVSHLNYENHLLTQVLLNEAIINEKVFEVYDLTTHDKTMVLAKEGKSIGDLPVSKEAYEAYLIEEDATKEFPLDNIRYFIDALPFKEFTNEEREKVENEFPTLYQGNNTLEEFCIRHQVNPINVWYWFKQKKVVPKQRMNTLAMEFLSDLIREALMEDQDGIIPLVPNAGEKILIDRIEEKFIEKGFSYAQYSSFDSVLGHPIYEYLNKYFFSELSDHVKLFKQLPATPFIWHLSSGPEQGFDCYIIIYKWSRDKLMRLRSVYIEHRERSLVNRQSDLSGNESADAQNEKDRIFRQLKEIEAFKVKIDELLAEGYNPILDDGVGKNIAPLQKKKMIPYEVLNAGQLKKYLNADW